MSTTIMPPGVDPQTALAPRAGLGHLDLSRIAQDLQIRKVQVEAVVQLLDEGNTIPFITRYRKERTGGMDEEVLRTIQERVGLLRQLADRKQTILRSIEGQGKLTDELRSAIIAADNPKRLEDLYLPYKPKKRSLAMAAREKGLDKLAMAIWEADTIVASLSEVLPTLVNPEQGLNTPEDVLLGAQHILAELVAESADVRAIVRAVLWDTGRLCTSKSDKLAEGQGLEYKDYFSFQEPIRQIPPHRILAINRGEKDSALSIKLEWDAVTGRRVALERLPLPRKEEPKQVEAPPPAETLLPDGPAQAPALAPSERQPSRGHRGHAPPPNRIEDLQKHPHREFLETVTDDALARLLVPSLEREIRRELTHKAENHAVVVFARNLRSKLLAAPLRGKRVLAVDPAFRTGCKLAALDETGNLLAESVIFPHPPQNKRAEARAKLEELICRHQVHVIAIGNGTACRETEELISDLLAHLETRRNNPSGTAPEASEPMPAAPEPQAAVANDAVANLPEPQAAVASDAVANQPEPQAAVTSDSVANQVVDAAKEVPTAVEPSVLASPSTTQNIEAAPALPVAVEGAPTPAVVDQSPAATVDSTPGTLTSPTSPESIGAETKSSETIAPQVTSPSADTAPAPPAPPPPPVPQEPLPLSQPDLAYVIVNEAGASVYSASPVGREEFPLFDATLRGTISIGRRLQDPLSELVKIDPQHVGVGLYQHDVNPKHLRESLDAVIESCVNTVGVDLNTASVPLLRHVSGLNALVARELVDFRKNNGPFRRREQLLEVPGIGEARFVQAAGFLKIGGGENPLDGTWIHPESYVIARQLLNELGYDVSALTERERVVELHERFKTLSPEEIANRLQIGVPTLFDIMDALSRPGRDPREDLPPPVFKKGILKLEDLQPGMELKGTVLNVVDFGAFIDIGLKDSGLVHISQMANRYVKSPYDVVAVGDVVNVWVLSVDGQRHRVSLTMIKPGSERRPQERRGSPPRRDQREPGRREQGPRDQAPRDQASRDQTPRDQTSRDQTPRDQASRDQAPRDQGPREPGQRDQGQREPGRRDQGQREPGQVAHAGNAQTPRPPRGPGRPQRDGPPREGQPRQGGGDRPGMPPRGRQRSSLPPRGTSRIGPGNKPPPPRRQDETPPVQGEQKQPTEGQAAAPPQQAKQPPARKPKRSPPPARLTQGALSGKEPLSTFGELAALLEAMKQPEEPVSQVSTATPSPAPDSVPTTPEVVQETSPPAEESQTPAS